MTHTLTPAQFAVLEEMAHTFSLPLSKLVQSAQSGEFEINAQSWNGPTITVRGRNCALTQRIHIPTIRRSHAL